MATPSELSLQEIRQYLLDNGGTARNRDLVKHFKRFLTEPETRVEARNNFKEYVNILASIKNEEDRRPRATCCALLCSDVAGSRDLATSRFADEEISDGGSNVQPDGSLEDERHGEKYLVLKKKYRESSEDLPSPVFAYPSAGSPLHTPDLSTPSSPLRDPPPYRPPPPAPLSPVSDIPSTPSSPASRILGLERPCPSADPILPNPRESTIEIDAAIPIEIGNEGATGTVSSPPVPPRRKSQDKLRLDNKENMVVDRNRNGYEAVIKEDEAATATGTPMTIGSAELLSVRERMQRFNRMASETDIQGKANGTTTPTKKRSDKQQGTDEDDRSSVTSQLDGKSREWLVRASQGDYQALAKLAAEEPRLTRLKNALHWGAKHGDENIVKLIAGTYKDYIKGVNETTNGGYTPLHIAMQFDHENIFNLLVQVYGANQEVRDHSGKKARQYLVSQEAAVSQDTFRKIKARKKHTERDLGFLRIGSLNVRVKRTTEAFSQFLGVATSATSNNDKIHKTWGSADNIQEGKTMPPPTKYAPIKKRRSRRAQDFVHGGSRSLAHAASSQPSTPLPQTRESANRRPSSTSSMAQPMPLGPSSVNRNDSDSDGACGFDSAWRGSAQL